MDIVQRTALFRKLELAIASAAILFGAVPPISAQSLAKAEELYQHTNYEASLALLSSNTQNAPTNFLIARDYFMLGEWKKATDFLLSASEEEPNNSEYVDWLGRAFGKRAETSNMLAAPGFASKARQAFERAVQLDPTNRDAMSDLFEYYLNAPGFMGGGYEKALAIADRTAAIDPPEGFFEKAKLAQKRKEYSAAELRFRQAVAAAPHQVGHLVSLAKFLAAQGRAQESDEVFAQAEQLKPNSPRVWYAHADVLVNEKRDLDQAKRLLQRYLEASITPDDPPKQQALRLLQQVGGA